MKKKVLMCLFVDLFFLFGKIIDTFRVRGDSWLSKEFGGFDKARPGVGGATTRKDVKRVCNLLDYITDG